jgi:hypothetical protein
MEMIEFEQRVAVIEQALAAQPGPTIIGHCENVEAVKVDPDALVYVKDDGYIGRSGLTDLVREEEGEAQ